MCTMQVEDDKAQITAVIQQLDEKKRIALEETWKHVSCRSPGLRVSNLKLIRHLLLMVAPHACLEHHVVTAPGPSLISALCACTTLYSTIVPFSFVLATHW